MNSLKTKTIREGSAEILIYEGKITKQDPVFFNPDMKFNRDVSVACLKAYGKTWAEAQSDPLTAKMTVCDVLAGSGIRGIRYLLEVPDIELAVLNDLNPTAVSIIKKNVEHNKVTNAVVEKMDANVLLSMNKNKFTFIDVDPFGSPAFFIDSAARALHHRSMLAATATDLGPLAGTYPGTCKRRYGAKSLKSDIMHETGIRILAGYMILSLAKYDIGFMPVLSFASRHYYRIFGATDRRRSSADDSISKIGFFLCCPKCGERRFSVQNSGTCVCGNAFDFAGPLYTGQLCDPGFIARIDSKEDDIKQFFDTVLEESKANGMLYDIHELCSKNKISPVKTEKIIKKLKEQGYTATRSTFEGPKIRTDAPLPMIIRSIIP